MAVALSITTAHAATSTIATGYPTNPNDITTFPGFADGLMIGSVGTDGSSQVARYNTPEGIAVSPFGNLLFFADKGNDRLRRLMFEQGRTETIAILPTGSAPVDVLADIHEQVYLLTQGDGLIRQFDQFDNLVRTNNATPLVSPTAMDFDANTNFFVVEMGGALKFVDKVSRIVTAIPVTGGGTVPPLLSPQGIAVLENGNLAVADTGHHVIRVMNTNGVITQTYGMVGVTNLTLGPNAFARFNGPTKIAAAGNNAMVITDTMNHRVVTIGADGVTRLLYGIDPAQSWNFYPGTLAFLPGWEDASDPTLVSSRLPTGVAIDGSGDVYTTELFYHVFRKTTDTGLTPPAGSVNVGDGTNIVLNPPNLTISPEFGYFPMGTTVNVTSRSADVYYTTDGSEPTTNSTRVVMSGNMGEIKLFNSMSDLSNLRVAAFSFNGTNFAVTNVVGKVAQFNQVGITRDVSAGIGSTQLVPISIDLLSQNPINAINFTVQVIPANGAPPSVGALELVIPGTNDFVQVVPPTEGGAPLDNLTLRSDALPGGGSSLGVTLPFSSGLDIEQFGVIAMLKFTIPPTAVEGDTYTMRIFGTPSATTGGAQNEFFPIPMPDRTLTVTNISYLVGDSSPGRWYGAGDFGNDSLSIADINNAYLVSLGVVKLDSFTDAFDAINAYPPDTPGAVGGGVSRPIITLADIDIINNRVIGVSDTNNWRRAWATGGIRTNAGPQALPFPAPTVSADPVATIAYAPHGRVEAGNLGFANPGTLYDVPISVKPLKNLIQQNPSLEGVQFRVEVTPMNGAPAISEQVTFSPAQGIIPSFKVGPSFLPVSQLGLSWLNQAFDQLTTLGSIQIRIPNGAQVGDCYRIEFSHTSSGPVGLEEALIESIPGCVVVGEPAHTDFVLPREWIELFFDTTDLSSIDPFDDPDGDGLPNWIEYLTGTDPADLLSRLEIIAPRFLGAGAERMLKLPFMGAPGRTYQLECRESLTEGTWMPVGDPIEGSGTLQEVLDTAPTDTTKYYRIRLVP